LYGVPMPSMLTINYYTRGNFEFGTFWDGEFAASGLL